MRRSAQPLYAVALGGLLLPAIAGHAAAQDLPVINMMSSNDRSCAMYSQFIMQDFGFLEKEGYRLNLLSSDTSVPYVAFLANGDADVAVLDPGQVLQAVNAGHPIKVVYELAQYLPEGIVVKADSPIQSLHDLDGATIGLASDKDTLTTVVALEWAGMNIDQVKTVVVGESGPVLAKALIDGTIDAFSGGSTDRAGIEAAGLQIRNITPPEVSRNPGNTVAVWGPTLEEKRPMIRAFLRSWAQSQHSGILEQTAVYMACKKRLPEQWEVQGTGPRIVINSAYGTQLRRTIKYGELQPDIWAAMQAPYVKMGEINAFIEPSTFLDPSFIDEINTFTTDDVKAGVAKFKTDNPDLTIPN